MRASRVIFGSLVFVLVTVVPQAAGDEIRFEFDSNSLGSYAPNSGATIAFELFVSISDADGDGPDSQGLAGFQGDLLTDVGAAPTRAFAAISENASRDYFITDPLWNSTGPVPIQFGGFGMGFVSDLGTTSGDDAIGIGAFMPLVWDADGHPAAGLQPYALANVGFGTPQTAVDSGGNPFDPAYGDARAKWYLLAGAVAVPDAPGTYTVSWAPGHYSNNVIRRGTSIELIVDRTDHIESATIANTVVGGSFSFTVLPEPAALSVLLLAGAALATRRRR
jgi:hypothetical protein